MGEQADTDKPHSHHALPKEPVTDPGFVNKAAPGVCLNKPKLPQLY
jgi:hypothetical protein